MSDDLTTAYMLGAEAMRSKLHKQAGEIERLRAENETLRRDVRTAVMGDSAELQDVKRDKEKLRGLLREAHVKMCEHGLWVYLRRRIDDAIRESGDE